MAGGRNTASAQRGGRTRDHQLRGLQQGLGVLDRAAGWRDTATRWCCSAGTSPRAPPSNEGLGDLLLAEGRVLIVLSEWYFRLGPRSHEEWNAALRAVVPPNSDRFAAVSVTPAALPTAVAALGAADLWGLGAAEAERRLLARLGIQPARASSGDTLGGSGGPRFPLEQPEVWGGVPRRNTRFTGREQLLGELHQQLQQAEPGAAVATLTACPASARPTSPPSTSTGSAPSTTWCGGYGPASAAPCARSSRAWPPRSAWSPAASTASGCARSATRCAAGTRTSAGWWCWTAPTSPRRSTTWCPAARAMC